MQVAVRDLPNSSYQTNRPIQGTLRNTKWILDSRPWCPDYRYWLLQSLSQELGLRVPNIATEIPDSKAKNSGFHTQKFSGFRDQNSPTWGDDTKVIFFIKNIQSFKYAFILLSIKSFCLHLHVIPRQIQQILQTAVFNCRVVNLLFL